MWVDNDYKGFGEDGVRKSWEWSRQWLNELRPVDPSEGVFGSKGSYNGKANGSGNGPGYFHEQLEYFGLPTDPASEIEHKNKAEEKAAINAMYVGPGKAKPVIPAKNAPKSQIKTSMYSVQGQNLTNAGSNSTIEKTAQDNFERLKGVLENVHSVSNSGQDPSNGVWKDAGRIEKLYRSDTVTDGKDRADLVKAIRAAGGLSRLSTTDSWGNRIIATTVKPEYYTKEVLLTKSANKEQGINTVFFVDGRLYIGGSLIEADGASGPDSTVYVCVNSEDGYNISYTKATDILDAQLKQKLATMLVDGGARLTGRHERFHTLYFSGDRLAEALYKYVAGEPAFYAVEDWYEANAREPDHTLRIEELCAELYAGGLKMTDPAVQKRVDGFVNLIDVGKQHGPLYSIQNTDTSRYAESQLDKDIFDLVSTKGPEALGAQVDEWLANHEAALEAAKIKAPAIPAKGFVPRSTSSERTTLDRMMQEQIKRYGKMKPSEKSNGFLIPNARKKGENYRGFHQNVGSAKNLPADARDLTLRELLTNTLRAAAFCAKIKTERQGGGVAARPFLFYGCCQ